mmetsp:Transcript_27061/g.59390  ORF Transcript_27061/g.59390 Transcript_27061/m.59390 type:complete len:132 (+) Transcript_27061:206-601(+)
MNRKAHDSFADLDLMDVPAEDLVPAKYWTIDNMSVAILSSHLLAGIEPTTLSKANLRSLAMRGSAAGNKEHLCKVLEFATGISSDFQLHGQMRLFSVLISTLQLRNMGRGRKDRDIGLPLPGRGMVCTRRR